MAAGSVAGLSYGDLEVVCSQTRFIEDGTPPPGAVVVGETWRYVNRKGGPDRRFNNNRQLPICLYGEIDFKSASGLNERIHCSHIDPSEGFVSAVATYKASAAASASTSHADLPLGLHAKIPPALPAG